MKEAVKSLVLLMLAVGAVQAQTSYPMLMTLEPIAIQVVRHLTWWSNHGIACGAGKVMVSGNGVTGVIVHQSLRCLKKARKSKSPV